jgi:hypothetical protein
MSHLGLTIGWQLALAVVVPVLLAVIILTAEARGPLAAPIQSSKGIVTPYFNVVAILFSLYAALLASDAWEKDVHARRLVSDEANSAQLIAHTAKAMDVEASVVPKLRAYLESSGSEMDRGTMIAAARARTEQAFAELVTTIVREPRLDPSSRALLVSETRDMMKARDDRAHLADDGTLPLKRLVLVLFGALTQVALMLVHVGGPRRAMRVSVGLFTVAFSVSLAFAAIFDSPFQNFIPHEPRASLGNVLSSLKP